MWCRVGAATLGLVSLEGAPSHFLWVAKGAADLGRGSSLGTADTLGESLSS